MAGRFPKACSTFNFFNSTCIAKHPGSDAWLFLLRLLLLQCECQCRHRHLLHQPGILEHQLWQHRLQFQRLHPHHPAPAAAEAPAPAAAIDSIDSIAGPSEEPAPAEGVAVANVAGQDDDNALLCAICQDLIREGDCVRKLRCPHSFHDECMEGWFGVTRDYTLRCPMRCVKLGFN